MTSARDLIRTNVTLHHTYAASPPPINWSTKPNRNRQNTATLDGSQQPSINTPPADSVTDESGEQRQLALLMRHLGHAVGVADPATQQDGTQSSNIINNATDTMHQLETAFLHLSTLDAPVVPESHAPVVLEPHAPMVLEPRAPMVLEPHAPVVLEPRAPPGFPSHLLVSPLPSGKKYYVILKGICTGVYYSKWDDIRCLVERIPGAAHKSFKTFEPAKAFYLHTKLKGNVRYIRNPGDAARYGPDDDAVQ